MKIRLMGTPAECNAAIAKLQDARLDDIFDVLEISGPYPNRPPSQLVRYYIDAQIARTPAEAEAAAR